MGHNKYRYNLNNISGEISGMNQVLGICSSSPQYVRHEIEKFSLIATAWRKRIFRSAQRNTEQSQFYQCANGDSHYCVTLFLNTTYWFPTGITIVQLIFCSDHVSQTLFFLKCRFQNISRCDQSNSCSCYNVMTPKHKYSWYIVFVTNGKAVKRVAC